MTPLTWTEPLADHMPPSASCVSNYLQLQDYYITEIMRLLGTSSFCFLCRSLMAHLCGFCLRSRGEQVHLVWAAPVAQRLLQLQKVLRVSDRPRFPDVQRGHPLPRLRQRLLSDLKPEKSTGNILLTGPLLHYVCHLLVSYTLTCSYS